MPPTIKSCAIRQLRNAHTADDLTPRRFHPLAPLHDHGALGQRELGQAMGVDPSILVTLLDPLEAGGLVSRQPRDSLAGDPAVACAPGQTAQESRGC